MCEGREGGSGGVVTVGAHCGRWPLGGFGASGGDSSVWCDFNPCVCVCVCVGGDTYDGCDVVVAAFLFLFVLVSLSRVEHIIFFSLLLLHFFVCLHSRVVSELLDVDDRIKHVVDVTGLGVEAVEERDHRFALAEKGAEPRLRV